MEPPPGIAFAHEVEWVCKEPALVVWNDPDRSDLSSLGLPCPTGKPTLLTLWIGRDVMQSTHILLHLRISVRISKRRKILDHFLLPSLDTSATESCSISNLEDASESVRQCLEEAYGKSSTKKCLLVPFHQPKQGRVLMPLVPEGAPCPGGTVLHLLTLFRSLSRAKSFEIFVGHSSYAQHALTNLKGVVFADGSDVDLSRSYNGGGVFDDWRQIGQERAIDCAGPQNVTFMGREGPQDNIPDHATSHAVDEQPICSPPPYSPPLSTTELPVTPQETRADVAVTIEKAHLKRSRGSRSFKTDRPPKSMKRSTTPLSTNSNVSNIHQGTKRSISLESTVYSPTIVNTPSTVEDSPPLIRPTLFTNKHQPPECPTNTNEQIPKSNLDKVSNKITSSSSPTSITRSLTKELQTLISTQPPLLPSHSLQKLTSELLSSLEYNQNLAEIGLQETSDDLKIELQLEKDKSIEEIEEHAQDVLSDVKSQMEDLASGHLIGFEELLQQTNGQFKHSLKALVGVAKAVVIMGRNQHITPSSSSPASAATKMFLDEFKDVCMKDKIKVLERLASQNTAEVFLTVDKGIREAWVASWIT